MAEWFLDPKSITLIGGTALAVAASVWQGRQTAAIVAELVKWRQDRVDPMLERHDVATKTHADEIGRLRDLKEGR